MKTESLKKNYVYNLVYQLLVIATPLITAPYTSRVFGPKGIGIYSYTYSIVSFFLLFAALGTSTYGQREIARVREDKKQYSLLFFEIEGLSLFSATITLGFWIIYICLINDGYEMYYLAHTLSILSTAFDISWFYFGFEKFRTVVLRNIIIRLLGVMLLFTLIKDENDLFAYIIMYGSINLIGSISLWFRLPSILSKIKLRSINIFRHLKQTLSFFVPTIAITLYTVMDKTMIGILTHDTYSNGYYEQAVKITKILQSILLSLNGVMYSRMSFLAANDKAEEAKEKIFLSLDYIIFISIPMCFGLVSIANHFVPWFFGPGYENVVGLIYILSPLTIIIGISNCLVNQYLIPFGYRKLANRAILIGTFLNLIINMMLIPRYGAYGAAVASVTAEFIIMCIVLLYSSKFVNISDVLRLFRFRLLISILMMIAIAVLTGKMNYSIITTIIQIAIGLITFTILTVIARDSVFKNIINIVSMRWRKRK